MTKSKKQSFLYGSIILVMSTLVVKVIGCFFKIPLQNLIGSVGMGYFNTSYTLFNLMFALSVAGLPMAVAKMVSQSMARHEYRNVKKILKISTLGFMVTGIVGSLLMVISAKPFVEYVANPGAYWCVMLMAPSIFFCCLSSAYRGYYEGLQNMYPTALSQVVEALVKLIIGYMFANIVMHICYNQYNATGMIFNNIVPSDDLEKTTLMYASSSAIFGITISTLIGSLYIWLTYKLKGDGISKSDLEYSNKPDTGRNIVKELVMISIPICLAAVVMNITSFIDTQSMMKRLEVALSIDANKVISMYEGLIPKNMDIEDIPNFLYGAYTGMATNIYNLVPSITMSFAISILPAVAAAITINDKCDFRKNMDCVLRITNLICIPAGLGLIFLSRPILMSLYGSRANEVELVVGSLGMLGIASIFVSLSMPINSMLQAVGKVNVPAKLMIVGAILKLVLNYYLIGIPDINIKGAPLGTIVCYVFVAITGLWVLVRTTNVIPNIKSVFIKPLIAGIICIVSAYVTLGCLNRISNLSEYAHGRISLAIAIIVGIIFYIISLILLKAIEKDDIMMLPCGEKFSKILEKNNIIG